MVIANNMLSIGMIATKFMAFLEIFVCRLAKVTAKENQATGAMIMAQAVSFWMRTLLANEVVMESRKPAPHQSNTAASSSLKALSPGTSRSARA